MQSVCEVSCDLEWINHGGKKKLKTSLSLRVNNFFKTQFSFLEASHTSKNNQLRWIQQSCKVNYSEIWEINSTNRSANFLVLHNWRSFSSVSHLWVTISNNYRWADVRKIFPFRWKRQEKWQVFNISSKQENDLYSNLSQDQTKRLVCKSGKKINWNQFWFKRGELLVCKSGSRNKNTCMQVWRKKIKRLICKSGKKKIEISSSSRKENYLYVSLAQEIKTCTQIWLKNEKYLYASLAQERKRLVPNFDGKQKKKTYIQVWLNITKKTCNQFRFKTKKRLATNLE